MSDFADTTVSVAYLLLALGTFLGVSVILLALIFWVTSRPELVEECRRPHVDDQPIQYVIPPPTRFCHTTPLVIPGAETVQLFRPHDRVDAPVGAFAALTEEVSA